MFRHAAQKQSPDTACHQRQCEADETAEDNCNTHELRRNQRGKNHRKAPFGNAYGAGKRQSGNRNIQSRLTQCDLSPIDACYSQTPTYAEGYGKVGDKLKKRGEKNPCHSAGIFCYVSGSTVVLTNASEESGADSGGILRIYFVGQP